VADVPRERAEINIAAMIEILPQELPWREFVLNSVDALICSTDGIGRPPPLFATDESSQSLTSDVDRCDVSWVRDCLEQANAEYLDSSWLDSPEPAGERTSIDFVSEVGEVWHRHRFSGSGRMFVSEMVFQIWTVQSGHLRAGSGRR
jgi:hypothetical protein